MDALADQSNASSPTSSSSRFQKLLVLDELLQNANNESHGDESKMGTSDTAKEETEEGGSSKGASTAAETTLDEGRNKQSTYVPTQCVIWL